MSGYDSSTNIDQTMVSTSELPPLVRDLLRKRGIEGEEAIDRFLRPDYHRDLADPFLMTDMTKAVERLQRAIVAGEKVAVYGDYDIDGVSSTALMVEVLEAHGLEPLSYIPDRYKEGYGVNQAALEQLAAQGVTLVLTVDCGITAVAEAAWAAEHGIDMVITDHHEVPDQIPQAVAVVNPKRPGDEYPFKELAGVGVAFALVRALQSRTGMPDVGQEKWLLDLVALGTVCDVMPLVGENRALVKYGLVVLQKTKRVGLVALMQSAGVEPESLRAFQIGFVLGPRLNAAGRMEHANFSLELLLTKDPIVAQQLAFQLEELNHQRQLEQQRIFEEANALAADYASDPVLVLADSSWPAGVVGIVASKLAESWGKPALVLELRDGVAKGSGRSAGGYPLIDGITANAELFDRFGGHAGAAGFTLPADNINLLRQGLNEHFLEVEPELEVTNDRVADIDLDDANQLNWELYHALAQLEPFGQGNTQPVFEVRNLKVVSLDTIGKNQQHLKLRLASPEGLIFESVGFNLAQDYPNLRSGQEVAVHALLEHNQYQGKSTLQLVLKGIQ
ncbi:single-stranded-DNA-specific exonuclease RecJ [Patescibacteria group bacterium]|nr:MAG: single-stranded-DNA-specific exonuclease RecJ [Patescibacteria group bacterium]